ncbi:MAG: GNAT family protein [Patescibacteria group bacterium]|mgnify:CR=1 FL=1
MSRSIRFTPGQILAFGHTKRGQEIIFRLPQKEDVQALWKFINKIVKEDTYVSTSEPISLKDEKAFLDSRLSGLKTQHAIYITAWVGKELAGVCGIDRKVSGQRRTPHVGKFGITIAKKFRAQGVGKQISLVALEAAQTGIPGLKIIELEVFGTNAPAVALYKKLSFKQYGKLPKGLLYKGKYMDEIFMYKNV